MAPSHNSLHCSAATQLHNVRGSIVLLCLFAAGILALAVSCILHSPSGYFPCGSLGLGHIIGYFTVLLLAFLCHLILQNLRKDIHSLRATRRDLQLVEGTE